MAVMFENLNALNRDLEKIKDRMTGETLVAVQKKLAIDAFSGFIKRTPVDEGRARGGWQMDVNRRRTQFTPKEKGEVGNPAGPALNKGLSRLSKLGPFDIVWITNNVAHTVVLDQGLFIPPNPGPSKDPREGRAGRILVKDGYSTQAPAGIVEPTIASLRTSLKGLKLP